MTKLRRRMKRASKRWKNKHSNRLRRKQKRVLAAAGSASLPPAQIVKCYVDETVFHGHGGFIQAAIPIPSGQPENMLRAEIVNLLNRHPNLRITEFKASKLKKGNLSLYREFLKLIVNFVASVGDESPLRAMVSIEGVGRYKGKEFDWVNQQVVGGLANLGVNDEPYLAAEFSNQLLWIWRFFPSLCTSPIANAFSFTFDNKHRYAQLCSVLKPIKLKNGTIYPWEQRKWMRSFANTMLNKMEPKKNVPQIVSFEFQFSEKDYIIQACDLLSHLVYNSLKFNKGIVTDNTSLKHQLLMEVMPGLQFPAKLLGSLSVVGTEVSCDDPSLSVAFAFDP